MDTDDADDKNALQLEEMHHLRELRISWINEKRSPELLSYSGEAVQQVAALIRAQHDAVAMADSPRHKDMRDIIQLDADRSEYILKSYLRQRLIKIQKYAFYYLEHETYKLSAAERSFATQLCSLQTSHYTTSFLHCLPPQGDYQSVSNPKDIAGSMLSCPDLTCFVFINVVLDDHVHEQVYKVVCGSSSNTYTLELNKGRSYLVKYADIRGLLEQGKVVLV